MSERSGERKKIRETILRGSPLLEVFLNGNMTDRSDWVEDMTAPFTELHNKFISYYGNSFLDMLKPLKEIGEGFDLFDSAYPENARELILNAVVIMGMEIGDKDACPIFAADIAKRLVQIRSFDQSVLADSSKKKDAANFINGVLRTGIAWGDEINRNDPDEFSRFISTLKF